jgi:O-glycosyl hydrolase
MFRKQTFFIWCTTIVLAVATVNFSQTIVTVDPSIKYQTFEGWGTSLCWWAELAGKWSEVNRNKLIGAIVDPDTGLGYSIFRYNIGGGDQPGHDHLTQGNGGATVPGFKPTETGAYDWNADPNQRAVLLDIASRNNNCIFEAFSNSPPWWMTKSGCVSGTTDGADNLKDDYFDNFADYLSEVVKHYKENWNITFRTVEPFNEPSAGWWKAMGAQEGCGFKGNQSKMISELGKALAAKGLSPQTSVCAADETSIEQALKSLNSYDASALGYLTQINTHSYSGYTSRAQLSQKVSSVGKRLWQSESGPLQKGDDKSNIALWMADVIIKDIRDMKAQAWIDWQICDAVGDWQTITANHSTQRFSYPVRYYMHAAFSRFIRPGSQIISSNNENTIAAIVPQTGNIVIVTRNGSTSNTSYTFDLSKFSTLAASAKIYLFSLPGSLVSKPDIQLTSSKQISVTVPSQSIVTCVIPDGNTGMIHHSFNRTCIADNHAPQVKLQGSNISLCNNFDKALTVSLFDLSGRIVRTKEIPGKTEHALLSNIPRGMYIIKAVADGTMQETIQNLTVL